MGRLENTDQVKMLFLSTDITNVSEVQSAIKEISENKDIAGSGNYLEALREVTPANISKARKYNKMSKIGKYLGWIIMALFAVLMAVIDSDFDDPITTWLSLGFWVGVGIQIYIAVLKSAWKKLTLDGTVIHGKIFESAPSTQTTATVSDRSTSQTSESALNQNETGNYTFCKECGHKNAEGVQFCTNCGKRL